jgi:hypothetical protein
MKYRVYYMLPEWFPTGIRGSLPTVRDLPKTHVFLREVDALDLDGVFQRSQGEVWSPNGEARDIILSKRLAHTSMCVGDVISLDDKFWVVASVGFKELLP